MSRDLNVDQIKKLWTLDIIIQTGSLKKAALQTKVSPSAISQTVSSLENTLGKPLLIRDKGRVTPTQDALSILNVVRPAFDAFEKLKDLNQVEAPRMTWLNFGTYESIAVDVLPGLMHRLRTLMPNLRLGLRIGRTETLLTMVRKGELCSAMVAEVDEMDRFYKALVYEDRLGVYMSARHSAEFTGLGAISKLGLGSLASGKSGLPRYYSKFLKRLEGQKPTVLCESFETLRVTAASGAITAVLPHKVAMRSDDLIEITPEGDDKNSGAHKIFVVSQLNCDREEADFLAREARAILN